MVTKLLRDSLPLVIDVQLATAVGLNEAIVLQQIHYWLQINKRDNKNFYEGHYWTFNSYDNWQLQFPFWSKSTIRRIFQQLENGKLLITGNFNKIGIDRTKWYRIDEEKLNQIKIPELKKPIIEELLNPSDETRAPCDETRAPCDETRAPCVQNEHMVSPNWTHGQPILTPPLPEINVQRLTTEIKKERDKDKKVYGQFSNVLLTDEEVTKLKGKFNNHFEEKIENCSEYLEKIGPAKAKKYHSHYATILSWARKDEKKVAGKSGGHFRGAPPKADPAADAEAAKIANELNSQKVKNG